MSTQAATIKASSEKPDTKTVQAPVPTWRIVFVNCAEEVIKAARPDVREGCLHLTDDAGELDRIIPLARIASISRVK